MKGQAIRQFDFQPVQQFLAASQIVQTLNALANLSQRQHAQEQRLSRAVLHPGSHVFIGLFAA